MSASTPRVGVVGGGVLGISLALRLAQAGADVTVVERGPTLGGLAGTMDFGGHQVDRFYHVITPADTRMIAMAEEVGLGPRRLAAGLAAMALVCAEILLQPDFGTFMVFVAILFGVLLVSGVQLRWLLVLALVLILVLGGDPGGVAQGAQNGQRGAVPDLYAPGRVEDGAQQEGAVGAGAFEQARETVHEGEIRRPHMVASA